MDLSIISKLYEVDPEFRDVYDALYPLSKSTDGADLHIDRASRKRKGVAAGLVAGSAAEGLAVHRSIQAVREMPKAAKITSVKPKGLKLKAIGAAHSKGGKIAEAAFQAGNLVVGLTAARELVAKPKKAAPVSKALSLKPLNPADVRKAPSLRARRRPGLTILGKGLVGNLKATAANAADASDKAKTAAADAAETVGKVKRLVPKRRTALTIGAAGVTASAGATYGATYAGSKQGTAAALKDKPVAKSFSLRAEISKVDTDRRQVFGWLSVSEIDGKPVVDLQGDIMPIEEVEKSAYQYVLECRVGGDQHARALAKGVTTNFGPRKTADLIESMVFTDEKVEALGLPEDFPRGWWGGMQVHDDETWQLIKDGKRTGFSVHGSGRREEVTV